MPGADTFALGFGLNPDVDYLPPGMKDLYKQPFYYTAVFTNVQSTLTTQTTNIQNDAYFVMTHLMCDIWDNATNNTTNIAPNVAPAKIRIIDASSGKQLMDAPVPLAALFGTGSQPYVLFQRAYVFRNGGQITLELTPRFTAAQNVNFTYGGFKVYEGLQDTIENMV